MGISSSQFNRVIDLSFLPAQNTNKLGPREKDFIPNYSVLTGKVNAKTIVCPRHGRKPEIEINGTMWANGTLPAFNVTVKNLYLDLQKEQYAKLRVRAGYDGNTTPIEGTILSMYQESPGPEGRTVIQCQLGNIKDWLEADVQLSFEAGTTVESIIDTLKTKLNTTQKAVGVKAKSLSLKEPFMFDGKARGAMAELEKRFSEYKLAIFVRENMICAICLAEGDFVGTQVLKYMSAPPQPNTGSEAGTYYTTITAPWLPKLRIGDILTIPSSVYMKNLELVGGAGRTQKIQVTAISFHFGTTGGTNRMTVQGFMVR